MVELCVLKSRTFDRFDQHHIFAFFLRYFANTLEWRRLDNHPRNPGILMWFKPKPAWRVSPSWDGYPKTSSSRTVRMPSAGIVQWQSFSRIYARKKSTTTVKISSIHVNTVINHNYICRYNIHTILYVCIYYIYIHIIYTIIWYYIHTNRNGKTNSREPIGTRVAPIQYENNSHKAGNG